MPNLRDVEVYTFGFRGFPNVQGGIETHAEHLTTRLVKLGFRVTACIRSPYSGLWRSDWNGVHLLRLWTVRNVYLEAMLHSFICVLVAGFRRPQIVHIHGIGPALFTPLARLFGLKVVVTHHGPDYNREKWGWAARCVLRMGEACGMRFANKRIAVSRCIEDLITTKYGKPCVVIPNGVMLPDIPSQADRVLALGLEPGRYVMAVGRLVPEKRQLDLLRAFATVRPKGWKLAIVGEIDHRNAYADRLAKEAEESDAVVMTGFQTGQALQQLYAHAGLFVLPSSHEGLPIVLLEALSFGLSVLVSDIPANTEVITDPGRIFRMGDVQELSAKLLRLTEVEYTAHLREAIRQENARRYDWAEIALCTSVAYQGLVRDKRGFPAFAS